MHSLLFSISILAIVTQEISCNIQGDGNTDTQQLEQFFSQEPTELQKSSDSSDQEIKSSLQSLYLKVFSRITAYSQTSYYLGGSFGPALPDTSLVNKDLGYYPKSVIFGLGLTGMVLKDNLISKISISASDMRLWINRHINKNNKFFINSELRINYYKFAPGRDPILLALSFEILLPIRANLILNLSIDMLAKSGYQRVIDMIQNPGISNQILNILSMSLPLYLFLANLERDRPKSHLVILLSCVCSQFYVYFTESVLALHKEQHYSSKALGILKSISLDSRISILKKIR